MCATGFISATTRRRPSLGWWTTGERHVRAEPDTSTVVLARTRAETRALSWLMRQRVLARTPDAKRAVIEVSRDLDGRVTEPLEIAVGDRIRIGATQWEKQLFNGTVVTVEDLEGRPAEAAAVTRKARNRIAAGKDQEADPDRHQAEFSVHVTALTDDGRRVTFRHDEIRDWHDNIRLDYGYAMTIASAQGLTVDRAFLLVDDRPARETIYPAATRHREALDIYVNRSPLAFDIAEHRPEDEAERPILDSDVRAYLAERWSRSQPKEAALDYTTDGEWRDPGDAERRQDPRPGDGRDEAAEAPTAANDNAVVRIAQEIRHAVNGWRHGAAVDAFAVERHEVMASWDELRARAREEGEAVALSPAFRETLDRNGALLKQAASFRARPRAFERILVERAGIGGREIEELREQHARAGRYLRSVGMKASQVARQDAPREEAGLVEAIAAGTSAPATDPAPEDRTVPDRPSERTTEWSPCIRTFGGGIPAAAPRLAAACWRGRTVRHVPVRPRRRGRAHPARWGIRGEGGSSRRAPPAAPGPGRSLQPACPGGCPARKLAQERGQALAALPQHIPARSGPRRSPRNAAPLPRLVAAQRAPAPGRQDDPRRPRDIRRSPRPHGRRQAAPERRGFPDGGILGRTPVPIEEPVPGGRRRACSGAA